MPIDSVQDVRQGLINQRDGRLEPRRKSPLELVSRTCHGLLKARLLNASPTKARTEVCAA